MTFSSGINPALIVRHVPARARSLPDAQPGGVIVRASLPGEPISVNHLYVNVPGKGRMLSEAGKDWKTAALNELSRLGLPHLPIRRYAVRYQFHGRWESQKGVPLKKDATNHIKALEDVLAFILGIDDKWFTASTCEKYHTTGTPHIEIEVRLWATDCAVKENL